MKKTTIKEVNLIGWRERVSLPALGISNIAAKIDTGSRTSALYATDYDPFEKGKWPWIRFTVRADSSGRRLTCSAPIVDQRNTRNPSGRNERRFVIETPIVLGHEKWVIDLLLTDRADMEYDLIVGRTALRKKKLIVNSGQSWLCGEPTANTTDESEQIDQPVKP